jgi:hypothetical protein
MKRALIVLLFAGAACAQDPADFRSRATVIPAAGDALHRLTLPFEVYRDARPDLADIRLFNARGEAMPIAFAGVPDAEKEAPVPAVSLPMFALYEPPPRTGTTETVDVRVKTGRDGTIVSVRNTPRGAPPQQRQVTWLLDASQLKTPIRALVLDWNAGPGVEVARVTVDASEDLKYWTPLTSGAPLLRVEQGGRVLAQPRVDLRVVKPKYLRITADRPGFVLKSVEAEAPVASRPVARARGEAAGTQGAKAGDYVFDLGARLPVEAVRLKLGAANSIAPVTLLATDDLKKEPQRVASGTFYWLVRDGADIQSPALEIGRHTARYWIARLDPNSPPPGGGPPTLEVEWRPAQLVFVARGDGPFTLAFGNPEVKRAVLDTNQLIPGYERGAELKLAKAEVGTVTSGEIKRDWIVSITGGANPRKLALWAVLIVAVIALAVMAYRLMKQV